MDREEEPLVIARPSRWPVRIAYALAVVTFVGAVFAWGELREVAGEREAVLASVDKLVAEGASDTVLREMMASYRDLGSRRTGWARTRLGLFLATAILVFGGFIGTGLLNLHDKMEWQVREGRSGSGSGDEYGGS